jgi:hypothetical protein
MEKNLKQLCKENFLAIEKKYSEIKKIANMSSNDPNFNYDATRTAQMYRDSYYEPRNSSKLGIVYPPYFIWLLNIAWYIIKHNLDDPKNKQKLIDFINTTYRHCDRWIGNPDYDVTGKGTCDVYDSGVYNQITEIIKKYLKVKEDGNK